MLNCMRSAIDASIVTFFQDSQSSPLTYNDVFYMATTGAAIALGMENKIGNFKVGKKFDALLIDMSEEISLFNSDDSLSNSEIFQKFLYTGDDRNISSVYVNGVMVKSDATSN
ncbi:guanine deaminase-like [Nilaparvata lugens]|nr:guanine deaminase-like [Nilaparvata lugens]